MKAGAKMSETIFWLIADLLAAIVTVYTFYKLFFRTLRDSIICHLGDYYFNGANLLEVLHAEFFHRFGNYTDNGFCYTASTLAMIALRNVRGTKIVRATLEEDGESYCHSWVEFRHCGIWMVCDPCWLHWPQVAFRRSYYRKLKNVKIRFVCKSKEFQAYHLSRQIEELLRRPETSHLFYEIYRLYGPFEDDDDLGFSNLTHDLEIGEGHGKIGFPFLTEDHIIFSDRIFYEFMTNPKRKRPRAHSIRKANRLRKEMIQELDKIEAERPSATIATPA